MLTIQKKLAKYNYSNGNKIEYIVIHDTGNTGKGANALAHYNYFNGGNRGASAHYFVDDNNIIQIVEDFNASWHCGDGSGKYGITNYNSIGIEICINSDGNYDKSVLNTIDLVKYLMGKYNISIEKIVRHYDASRKSCPNTMSANNWAKWNWFKSQLGSNTTSNRLLQVATPLVYGDDVKELQRSLIELGYKVDIDGYYGNDTKNVVIQFQKNSNLTADGIVGEQTKKVIETFIKIKKENANKQPIDDNKIYRGQVGAYKNKENAEKLLKELESKGFKGFIKEEILKG